MIVGRLPENVVAAEEITTPVNGSEALTLVRELRVVPHVQWRSRSSRLQVAPIKHGRFPIKHGDSPIKHGH